IGDGWWVRSGIGWEPLRMNFAAPCVSAGRGRSQTCPYRKRAYCDGWQRRGGIGWGLPRINFVALCVSAGWGQVSDLPLQETGVLRWLAGAQRDWVGAAAATRAGEGVGVTAPGIKTGPRGHWRGPGAPAAPGRHVLWLLPLGPDQVRRRPPRRTQSSPLPPSGPSSTASRRGRV